MATSPGSGDEIQTWQEALDLLTTKAKRDNLIRAVENAPTFEEKVRKVLDSIAIRYVTQRENP